MHTVICTTLQEWANTAADIVQQELQKPAPNFILPTGGTPVPMYQELCRRYREGQLSFAHAHSYNLDEYVGLAPTAPQSYRYFMQDNLFDHVDIPAENTNLPNGLAADLEEECKRYEALVRNSRGIDLAIVGIGHTGHIGFNEPGTPFDSMTHVAELTQTTVEANARFFDDDVSRVPTLAITMGLDTIMQAKKVLLLATGKGKAEIIRRTLEGEITTDVSATVLRNHPNVVVLLDREAASELPL